MRLAALVVSSVEEAQWIIVYSSNTIRLLSIRLKKPNIIPFFKTIVNRRILETNMPQSTIAYFTGRSHESFEVGIQMILWLTSL